jgi:hypothetical protein
VTSCVCVCMYVRENEREVKREQESERDKEKERWYVRVEQNDQHFFFKDKIGDINYIYISIDRSIVGN